MAAAMIQPYRTGQKNDQNDAEAICEAVSRPRTRFVPVKSEAQQAVLTVVFGFAVAAVSYALVESPCRVALRRWERRNDPAPLDSSITDAPEPAVAR